MFRLHKQGTVKVISGTEPLNLETVKQATQVCSEAANDGQPRLVFDLRAVPLIDSAGLELLLDTRDRCRAARGALHLAAPNALCLDILTATRTIDQFGIFDTTLSAVGSFAQ